MQTVIPATDCSTWREWLSKVGPAAASYLPEYHLAYAGRIENSTPLMWCFEADGNVLVHPFLLTPVHFGDRDTGYTDLTSIYGYVGPLSTTTSSEFLGRVWDAFDRFAKEKRVLAEFVRFSPFNKNEGLAPPGMRVELNRSLAASFLPDTEEALLQKLGGKTRNMLRKAERSGFTSRELSLPESLPAFRKVYEETMDRNQAKTFFWYDDAYYEKLLMLGKDDLRAFGVFEGETLMAAAMAVVNGTAALYHLGASLPEAAKKGAGNLSLFEMSRCLMKSGVTFVNMTGGRTSDAKDPLLLFKRSNATGTVPFHIGKRIVDAAAYDRLAEEWRKEAGKVPDSERLIYWRA